MNKIKETFVITFFSVIFGSIPTIFGNSNSVITATLTGIGAVCGLRISNLSNENSYARSEKKKDVRIEYFLMGYGLLIIGIIFIFLFKNQLEQLGVFTLEKLLKLIGKVPENASNIFKPSDKVVIGRYGALLYMCIYFMLVTSIINNYRRCKELNNCDFSDLFLFPIMGLMISIPLIGFGIVLNKLWVFLSGVDFYSDNYFLYLLIFIPIIGYTISSIDEEIKSIK
jgi:hypothetical protein